MHFTEYQSNAEKTDQTQPATKTDIRPLMIPLLGLAGESGSLLTEYKKYLRDGDAYKIFHERISEELGDILWYISTIATKAGLDLEEIARKNLEKTSDRWHEQSSPLFGTKLFDDGDKPNEQFPREFVIEVRAALPASGKARVQLYYNGKPFGNELTDNAYEDDGYRLHDVFHLAFLAVLGWSPVLRGRVFFDCKRRSSPEVDEVQDGGRAAVIDEAIAALIFTEAKKHSFFEGVDKVQYEFLRTIKDLTAHLEVGRCSAKEWEIAILQAFQVWRALKNHGQGRIIGNLRSRKIEFEPFLDKRAP
jgi:NTP pyrophosphatase (non-canonical NTP hydrolase)